MVRKFFRTSALIALICFSVVAGIETAFAAGSRSTPTAKEKREAEKRAREVQRILKLPAFQFERLGEPDEELKVGDVLKLRLGENQKLAELAQGEQTVQLQPFPGSDSLLDQSWYIKEDNEIPVGKVEIQIAALSPGDRDLPSLLIRTSDGKEIARTEPLSVRVAKTPTAENEKPADFQPPVEIDFPLIFAILVGLGVLILIILGVWAAIRYSNRNRPVLQTVPVPKEPPKPEDQVALAKLSQLENQELWKARKYKALYFGVSDILKEYFGRRYDFDASESTSKELLGVLSRESQVQSQLKQLRLYFGELDLVKFTDELPKDERAKKVIEDARFFIQKTKRPKTIHDVSQSGHEPILAGSQSRREGSK